MSSSFRMVFVDFILLEKLIGFYFFCTKIGADDLTHQHHKLYSQLNLATFFT